MFFIIYVSLSIKITLKHLNTIEYTVPESPPVNKSTVGASLYCIFAMTYLTYFLYKFKILYD